LQFDGQITIVIKILRILDARFCNGDGDEIRKHKKSVIVERNSISDAYAVIKPCRKKPYSSHGLYIETKCKILHKKRPMIVYLIFEKISFNRRNPNFFGAFNAMIGALLLHENVITNPEMFTFFDAKFSKIFLFFVYN